MGFKSINHVSVSSNDVEADRAFYEAMGCQVSNAIERQDKSGFNYLMKTESGDTIEIQVPRFAKEGENFWDHLAIEVDDIEKTCEMIEEAGGRVGKKPSPNKVGDLPAKNAVVFSPGGEKIELIEML